GKGAREPKTKATAQQPTPSAGTARPRLVIAAVRSQASASDRNRGAGERVADELLGAEGRRARLRRQDKPMREHRGGDGLHVVGDDEVAPFGECPRLRDAQQRDPGPRARAEVQAL